MTTNSDRIAYSIDEAVEATSICKSSLYGLIRSGRLEVRKVGRRTLVPAASLRRLIEGGE